MPFDRYDIWALLAVHAVLALGISIATAWTRWWLLRGAGRDQPWTAIDIAYLNGGLRLSIYACLAELNRLGLVRATASALIATERPLNTAGDPPKLLVAVWHGLTRPQSAQTLMSDPDIGRVSEAVGSRLVRRGWMLSAVRQQRLRLLCLPGVLVLGWCLTQVAVLATDFAVPGRATLVLGLVVIVLCQAVATFFLFDVPPVTRAGQAVRRRAREELKDRDDGPSLMARVATYGEPVIWKADPAFAKQVRADSGELTPMPRVVSGPIP